MKLILQESRVDYFRRHGENYRAARILSVTPVLLRGGPSGGLKTAAVGHIAVTLTGPRGGMGPDTEHSYLDSGSVENGVRIFEYDCSIRPPTFQSDEEWDSFYGAEWPASKARRDLGGLGHDRKPETVA